MSTSKYSIRDKLNIISFWQAFILTFHTINFDDNLSSVVYRLLRKEKVRVTFTSISEYIKSHPNYPTLKCICDFFDDMNIQNYAVRIGEKDLYELKNTFIAHIKDSGGKVIMVYEIDKDIVVFADSLARKRTMATREFLNRWEGVVIIIEPTELSGEPYYKEKRKNEIVNNALLPSSIIAILLLLILGISTINSVSEIFSGITPITLLLGHLIGLISSLLLLRKELNLKSNFTDKLCHIATNVDCDAVTKSNVSKIFGNITWADSGTAYFTGGILVLFLLPASLSVKYLSLISIMSLPYPVFSVLYQWLKIQKWCPLCLSVQLVIILESVLAFRTLSFNELKTASIFPIFIIFSTVFIFELVLKLLFISNREKEQINQEALKMKRDPDVFLYKLKQGKRLEISVVEHAMLFGNTQSNVLISVFLSLHCSSCSEKFDQIVKLIDHNYKIKILLIFSPSKDEISKRLLMSVLRSLKSGDQRRALEELRTWFKTDSKSRLKLPLVNNIEGTKECFEEMITYNEQLFNKGKIFGVPSIYVNGYRLNVAYSLEDIRYHIAELEKMNQKLIEREI
jgi:uncharacterized membrane protein